jgi:hypothetical protein
MAITKTKTWGTEILTSDGFNGELDNIIDNALDLISPLTGVLDANGNKIDLDEDADTSITVDTDDRIDFEVGGQDIVRFDATAGSPVNGIDIIAGQAGAAPTIQTNNAVDIGISFEAQNDEEMLILANTPSAVNEITITSAATGNMPTISATSDTDTDIGIDFENDQSEEILRLRSVATGVNDITITNAATGNNPTIACTGDESDIGITLQNQDAEPMLVLDSVATSTNWVTITSAAGGADATVIGGAAGADAGITIQGKGTGTVKLGDASLVVPDSDGAAGNYIMVTDGNGTLSLASNVIGTGVATATVIPMPRGHLQGLTISREAINDVNIAYGECRGGTAKSGANFNLCNMIISAAGGITKQLDAAWAAGDDAGGYAGAGAIATDTWYHVFVIEDGAGTVDAGFDDDIDCTNLLAASSYTNFRRIGSILTTAADADDMLPFTQIGDEFVWTTLMDAGATTPTSADHTALALDVPPDVNILAVFNMDYTDNTVPNASISVYSGVGDQTGGGPDTGYISLRIGQQTGDNAAGQFRLLTDTSSQIGYHASTTLENFSVGTLGWVDRRGRDD